MDNQKLDPFSNFLYPFLDNQEQGSVSAVLEDIRVSTLQKAAEVATMRQNFFDSQGNELVLAAKSIAASFQKGGQLLTMGNGGSATDAQDMTADFLNPPDGFQPLPAISLTNDIGVLTAVGNDVGFDNVYTRQVIAFGRSGDILIGFSTSGQSPNLIAAFEQAKKMALLTIGITGYDGGRMAKQDLDYCFIVHSSYVPRIQEVHATIYHTLWTLAHEILSSKERSEAITKI
jgi:D-sedoheptulose 7-phosphate isomerase